MCLKELDSTWLQNLEKLRKLILSSNNIIIIPHANADPDALASSCIIAYLIQKLKEGLEVNVIVPEGIGLECRKILEICSKNNVNITVIKRVVSNIFKENSLCILIDVASIEQIKSLKNYINQCNKIVVIDHHAFHEYTSVSAESMLLLIRFDVSSTSEIVFDIVKRFSISIPKEFLEILITGILWDTGHFARGTSSAFRCVSEILELGADYQNAKRLITLSRPPHAKIAKIKCILRHRGFKVTLNDHDIYIGFSEVGAYESECASAMISVGYDIAFVVSEEESLHATRVIYRTREDPEIFRGIDIYNDILKQLIQKYGGGGGGHKSAGGAIINVSDMNIVLAELLKILSNLVKGKIVELEEEKVLEG
jgi:nanoRNase/pAp phosphatase (c-di-AMP/oligoRNAs hydrolase)